MCRVNIAAPPVVKFKFRRFVSYGILAGKINWLWFRWRSTTYFVDGAADRNFNKGGQVAAIAAGLGANRASPLPPALSEKTMQRAEEIELSKIGDIVSAIFLEPAVAYQDYSDFDSELKQYENEEALMSAISNAIDSNAHSANFSIYYPEAKGYFFGEKKSLNPTKCNGAAFRYVASGWGMIQLQIDLKNKIKPGVRVSVNSRKRADAWFQTYPEFREPSLWEWKFVEKQARRIIRVLKQCA